MMDKEQNKEDEDKEDTRKIRGGCFQLLSERQPLDWVYWHFSVHPSAKIGFRVARLRTVLQLISEGT